MRDWRHIPAQSLKWKHLRRQHRHCNEPVYASFSVIAVEWRQNCKLEVVQIRFRCMVLFRHHCFTSLLSQNVDDEPGYDTEVVEFDEGDVEVKRRS